MDITLPQLGEGIESVEVTDILVSEGGVIKKDDIIIIVESDKASMEIPSKINGNISKINISKGDAIKPGDLILKLEDSADTNSTFESTVKPSDTAENKEGENNNLINQDPKDLISDSLDSVNSVDTHKPENQFSVDQKQLKSFGIVATPSIKKFARELGCDLSKVQGTAKNERITKEDILDFVKQNQNVKSDKFDANQDKNLNYEDDNNTSSKSNQEVVKPPEQSQIDENKLLKYGPIQKILFNKIRTITADRMITAWSTIPHVTHFDEIEIDHILNLKNDIELATDSKKVSILTFISKALIDSISKMEKFNSFTDMKNNILIVQKFINLGIAVDTSNGLIVPNIKNAEKLSMKELNDDIIQISKKAHNRSLTPSDISDGTFTISSLGGIGGRYFTPIINKPEVAIMGVSRIFKKVSLNHNRVPYEVNILPFSLSYDHRVIDGAEAAKFCNLFKNNLKNLSVNG